MSTAYPPRLVRYLFSSKKERRAADRSLMNAGNYGDFPTVFGMYYTGPGDDYLSQRFHFCAIADGGARGEALHAITFHKGPGLQHMTLYPTPVGGLGHRPLAVAANQRRFGTSAAIKLPGDGSDGAAETEARVEHLHFNGIGANTYTFAVDGKTYEVREDRSTRPRMRLVARLDDSSSKSRTPAKEAPGNMTVGQWYL